MMQQAYRCPSNLHYGDVIIKSKRGTQQGDPCASVAFCIGMKRLTHALSSVLNAWFMDDGTIGDNFDVILKDVEKVLAFAEESGLTLNTAKCEVFFVNTPDSDRVEMLRKLNSLLPGIKELDMSSFQLLGAPIMDDGVSEILSSGLDTVKTMCKRLTSLDVHPALRVLRSSLSSARFQYLLRTSPTFLQTEQLILMDDFYRQTLEAITNNKIHDTSWTQASLPLSFAGLGIRKLVHLAHPAYFSSLFQSEELSNKILAKSNLSVFNERLTSMLANYPPTLTPATPELKKSQKAWDLLHIKTIHEELLSSSGPIDRARLLASSTKTSSKWLQAIPSHQLGLLLDNNSARIAIALRLGNKVCEPHVCKCGKLVNSNGHHGLSCKNTKGKYSQHTEINKIFSMAFTAANVPNSLEPYGLSRRDGKRPDGLTSYPWSHGKSLLWDVTVVDTVATSYVSLTSVKDGAAADLAERGKHNDYIDLKQQFLFTPLAFETFGSIGPETEVFMKKLGKLMKRNTGEPRSLDFLQQRISIAIQRGNATCVRNSYCDTNEFNVFM